MTNFLTEQNIEHKIFICNQVDDKLFNRGKVKNIAFDIAKKEGYDYFVFHDIDMIPEDSSCDYSYPEHGPVHLSNFLSSYNYKLPYLENFGGCVLFTKDQFEKINGYYNEYWDWGAEDDDLFWRCQQNNFVNISKLGYNLPNKKAIRFSKSNSSIKIPLSVQLKNMLTGNYSFSFLIKTDVCPDIPKYLAGDPNSKYISMPLLMNGAFPLLSWVNSGVYTTNVWDENKNVTSAWFKEKPEEWVHLIITVDRDNNELRMFSNGIEANDCPVKLNAPSRTYNGEPLIIGNDDLPTWLDEDTIPFKGDIARISFWNRAINKNEINEIHKSKNMSLPNSGLILDYDFEQCSENTVPDISGNDNDGKIFDTDIISTDITEIATIPLPYRRKGRYLCLEHENEGMVDGKYTKEETSAKNEKILIEKVFSGEIDISKNGLNNLEYKIINTMPIYDKHLMINVEC